MGFARHIPRLFPNLMPGWFSLRWRRMKILNWLAPSLSSLACICARGELAGGSLAPATSQPATLRQVRIEDRFWAPKLKVYREQTIPHSWQFMQGELRALQAAGGQSVTGELNGTWGEANLYKFLETAANSLALVPDPELERKVNEVVALVAGAQQPDGYVHAFVTNSKKIPWDPDFLDGSHDGYVLGHLIQAALALHAATGKRTLLEVACRAADQAHRHFLGPGSRPGFCGHAELELALVELYRVVPEQRYLELAKALVEWRGRRLVKPVSETPRAYFQDQLPLREQTTLEGHAVRAVFFATGVADLGLATGSADYRLAANRFWESTAHRRMNIAGGIGPRAEHEALGEDYELPDDGYYESCAACGLADFAERMSLLEGLGESTDVLERVLYNAILHGISLDGTHTYYRNPLSDHDHPRDNCWVCCPPNLSRTLLRVGLYAYRYGEREIFVNLFMAGSCTLPLKTGPVTLRVETDYPWEGDVKLGVHPDRPGRFTLNLRQPGWCEHGHLEVNGEPVAPLPRDERGYLRVEREWKEGDKVVWRMDMPVQRIEAHPNIRNCVGKVALQRGPLVYALEGLDNAGTAQLALEREPRFRTEHRPDFLGGVTVIHGVAADEKPFLAIPFYALANRGASIQEVWVAQRGLKPTTEWWLGSPLPPDPARSPHSASASEIRPDH